MTAQELMPVDLSRNDSYERWYFFEEDVTFKNVECGGFLKSSPL
jgi:hypothetical protein